MDLNIRIICNEKGMGKSTFVKNKYIPNQYFTKDTIENYNDSMDMQLEYCIIDSIDSIPKHTFNKIMNEVISRNWKAIILVFDIKKDQLANCDNFINLWECGLIPRNYLLIEFTAASSDLYTFLARYYPEIDEQQYDKIIDLTDSNYRNIDRLMMLNRLNLDNNTNNSELSTNAIVKYIDVIIQAKFKDIPEADILLQKASIIGERFVCDALESPNGFAFEAGSAYLKQMEEMHGIIRKCIDADAQYEFSSHDIYKGIYQSITNKNKITWLKILIHYYKAQYERCSDSTKQIYILNKLNSLYTLFPNYMNERKSVCYLLFYCYQKTNKTYNALEIAKEITETLESVINKVEYSFIQNFRIKAFMQIGEYKQALVLLQDILDNENYPGSKMLMKYYYAYSLFLVGDVDLSYSITESLIAYLKNTSGSNLHSQELYCMTYSLAATLLNHLNLDDGGFRYYKLALNNAKSRFVTKKYYYDILRKCDMFYPYNEITNSLDECLVYYRENGLFDYAGEVCINLATELMFQDCKSPKKIKAYFEEALSYFSEYNNEKLAYAKNNFGIYYILVENNISKGLLLFKEALLIGLSDFSYMSIYLNICMCYIILGRLNDSDFDDAYYHFIFAKKKLNQRSHETKYENIYEQILNIIVKEHCGINQKTNCEEILNSRKNIDFYLPLLNDIIKRNSLQSAPSSYPDNNFFYTKMNELHCFFAEFRFWE